MILDFCKKNWILLILQLISSIITIIGIFYKCTTISIIGAILALFISIFNAFRSYQTNKKVTENLEDLDDRTIWHNVE